MGEERRDKAGTSTGSSESPQSRLRGEERNGHKEDKTMEHLSKESTQVIMTLEAALSDMFEAIDEVQTAKMVLMQEREQGNVKAVTH